MSTDKESRKIKSIVALTLIIVLQLVRIIYSFVYLKEDFHSDEMWSYGLSNSYYEPFIYQNAEHTDFTNYKTWFSSKVMRDYLTVDESQRFSYGSVYYNQVHDYHPPFYYFVLHTICSFFPGKFSPWYSFSINIASFVGTIVFLYLLIKEINDSEKIAFLGCLFYGFSLGAFNTFEFIRIYAPATMISTMYLYYHAKLYHADKMKKNMIILFIITLIGCLTHHFFIPFAGCVSACFCVYYLIKKTIKKLIVYSVSMLSSVAASLAIFPATIDHLFSGRIDDNKYPFFWQIKLNISCMTSELFGFSIPVVSKFSFTANLIAVVCVLAILSPLVYLFRKEIWFKKLISAVKTGLKQLINHIKDIDFIVVSLFVSVFGLILLTSLTVSNIHMGRHADRYIFIAFPAAAAFWVICFNTLFSKIKMKCISNILLIIFCFVPCVISNMFGPSNYLFQKEEGATPVQDFIRDSNCVFISDDFWLLTCFTRLSMDSDYIYALRETDLKTDIDEIPDAPDKDKELYFFIDDYFLFKDYEDSTLPVGQLPDMGMSYDQSKRLTQAELENQLRKKYSMCEYVGFDDMFMRKFLIYRVN